MRGTTRPLWAAALWCWWAAAQDVTPPPGAVLLDLELTVDNTPTRLRLHQDQSFLDAARQACTPTETPEAKRSNFLRVLGIFERLNRSV